MRIFHRKKAILSACVSATAMFYATSATAQSNAGSSNDASPPDPRTAIAEIVVTAQKRSERLQDVPIAVAAVTADTLNRAGVESTQGLTALVPGLNLNQSAFGFRPFIRGVGTSSSASGNENPVSTYIDGVYIAQLTGGYMNLTNIDAVEVLKGPQGTLFGRNATGGVINIRTKDPSHTFGGDAAVSFDNYQTLVAKGYVTAGLSDTVAMDLAAFFQHQYEGYGVNTQTGNEVNWTHNLTLRSKILFEPTDEDRITIAGDYSRIKDTGNTYNLYGGATGNCGAPDATHPLPCGAPSIYTGDPYDIDRAVDPSGLSKGGGASLTYERSFPWAILTSITAYRRLNTDTRWIGTPVPTLYQDVDVAIREKQFTQELQLSSTPESAVKWIVGAYYVNSSSAYDPFQNRLLAQAPRQTQWYAKSKIDSPAIYGQVTVPVEALGDTNITGGLRYTIDHRSIVGRIEQAELYNPDNVLATLATIDAKKTYKTFTWRLAIDHHFNKDLMVYASYNRGFKAGAFNTIPPGPVPADPEYLDAYEVGFKSTLLDRRLTFNMSAFLYEYQNLQVTIFSGTAAVIENAASASVKGVDFELNFQATPNLRLFASGEFLDHKYSNYPNGPQLTLLTLAQGGGATRAPGDLSGNPLIYTADTAVSGGAYYEIETNAGTFDLNGVATWNSGYTVEPSAVVKVPSFWQINASAGWTFANGTTRIGIFGRNLANELIPRSVPTATNPGGYVEANYQPPRTYGIQLSQKF